MTPEDQWHADYRFEAGCGCGWRTGRRRFESEAWDELAEYQQHVCGCLPDDVTVPSGVVSEYGAFIEGRGMYQLIGGKVKRVGGPHSLR